MGKMRTHKDLDIWKLGIELVEDIYKLCNIYPNEEKFGIVSQIKRASISIPSNIAEGSARNSKKEFIQFCYIALGSLSEIETQLIISKKLQFISTNDLNNVLGKIEILRKKLLNFIKYLKRNIYETNK